jgi:hypothetical protein
LPGTLKVRCRIRWLTPETARPISQLVDPGCLILAAQMAAFGAHLAHFVRQGEGRFTEPISPGWGLAGKYKLKQLVNIKAARRVISRNRFRQTFGQTSATPRWA